MASAAYFLWPLLHAPPWASLLIYLSNPSRGHCEPPRHGIMAEITFTYRLGDLGQYDVARRGSQCPLERSESTEQ